MANLPSLLPPKTFFTNAEILPVLLAVESSPMSSEIMLTLSHLLDLTEIGRFLFFFGLYVPCSLGLCTRRPINV